MVTAPWYWQSLPLQDRSGAEVFAALFGTEPIATLLESPRQTGHQLSRFSICAGGPRQTGGKAHLWTPRLGTVLPFLEGLLAEQKYQPNLPAELPFTGGWLGWLGYDVAWEIEHLPWRRVDTLPFPVAFWYEPAEFVVLDHAQQTLWLAVSDPARLAHLEDYLFEQPSRVSPSDRQGQPWQPHFYTSQAEYQAAVQRAQAYIQAGDIFQTNLTLRFGVQAPVQPWLLYQQLQQINPSPFASFWQTPWGQVISCSPERLVQVQGTDVQTRPIAGTRPRGQTPEQTQTYAAELLSNAKENAEHIMLVDLERNDLGRVCTNGSVEVDELLALEYYSHVIHLVSNVRGQRLPGCTGVDVIRALFPGGTITGCPKVRCMEIIEELEPVRRSLFYGSCGYLDQRGNLDLNILIRTLLVTPMAGKSTGTVPKSIIWGQVGAGIVADSDPEREWLESLQKAQAQMQALKQLLGCKP
jgi:para-aminobenzoate synthetase component I